MGEEEERTRGQRGREQKFQNRHPHTTRRELFMSTLYVSRAAQKNEREKTLGALLPPGPRCQQSRISRNIRNRANHTATLHEQAPIVVVMICRSRGL
jgi:hypothetical protein